MVGKEFWGLDGQDAVFYTGSSFCLFNRKDQMRIAERVADLLKLGAGSLCSGR